MDGHDGRCRCECVLIAGQSIALLSDDDVVQ